MQMINSRLKKQLKKDKEDLAKQQLALSKYNSQSAKLRSEITEMMKLLISSA